jgi:hypothetical protein
MRQQNGGSQEPPFLLMKYGRVYFTNYFTSVRIRA